MPSRRGGVDASAKTRSGLDLTLEPHLELVAKNPLGCMVQWIAGRENPRQAPRFQRMPDQPISERGRVTPPVVFAGQHPAEFDIVFVEVATGSKTGEADRFVVGFQRDSPVAEMVAVMKVVGDEGFRLRFAQRTFVEDESHQFPFAKNRDERLTVSILIRPQQHVSGVQNHRLSLLSALALLLFRSGYVGFGFDVLWFKTGLAPEVIE